MDDEKAHMLLHMKNNLGWTKNKLPFKTALKVYPKGHCLLSSEELETNIHYLVSGIVEASLLASNGEEKIMDFFFLNNFFCSMSSIITNKPTKITIKCLTECTIETVKYKDFSTASEKSRPLNKISRRLLEQFYLYRVKKEKDLMTKNASERYLDLVKHRPDIMKEIPLEKIAKYLGIHPRSLSRIRKNAFKQA